MKDVTRAAYERSILRVQMHLQETLDNPFDPDGLAALAGFSRFHFSRLFMAMTGETLADYRRRLLLERAAHDLLYRHRSVTDLAFEAGYETPEAFTRAFGKLYGVPPGEFRRRLRWALGHREDALATRSRICTITLATEKGGLPPMDVKIEHHDALRVAFVRHVGPYAACEAAWETLCGAPNVAPLMGPETLAMGICYDDPDVTDADHIRLDVCVTVGEAFQPGHGVEEQTIAGGDFAVAVHRGPYENLHDTYRALYGTWLPQSGREPQGAYSLEIYRTDPRETPPEEWRTEIRIPLV